MSEWSRPGSDGPVEEARIEVPLAGEDADAAPGTDVDGRPAPNWRKITGISALAGIALGLVVAIVMLTSGSDDDPPETTIDPDELSDAITVPPSRPDRAGRLGRARRRSRRRSAADDHRRRC